mmetsp:Transcript_2683/g.3593  ORF Transcript_2683/g.3593 Transcript_2683/m.3593 type:complete len:82 (-) Transcript_2683:338-583(-)|eukprot:CAMPEP_0198144698 /NCGR_PEP_ID=MMETSP1443-20131203/17940_1 /TAXON_ID=186043 /ORGANISM="Entomoneis sp., Strain CCMP2396" /LENGTH=81 /DNA_ID=CAMNT_0043808149 /DNA_START=134 /DNA_END=379 /DNA_ORIENTATION=-
MASMITKLPGIITKAAHNYYHPLIRQGSIVPLYHMFAFVGVTMYTVNYTSYGYGRIQHKHQVEKAAKKEYWDKRGGEPDHH